MIIVDCEHSLLNRDELFDAVRRKISAKFYHFERKGENTKLQVGDWRHANAVASRTQTK